MDCKEYQEDLRIKAANDKAAQETQKMLEVRTYVYMKKLYTTHTNIHSYKHKIQYGVAY